MKLWIARDKNGELVLYKFKPKKSEEYGMFYENTGKMYDIDDSLFPSVTWENSPQELEIKLIKREEK